MQAGPKPGTTQVSTVSFSCAPNTVSSRVLTSCKWTPVAPKAAASQLAGMALVPMSVNWSEASVGDCGYHAVRLNTTGAGEGGGAPTELTVKLIVLALTAEIAMCVPVPVPKNAIDGESSVPLPSEFSVAVVVPITGSAMDSVYDPFAFVLSVIEVPSGSVATSVSAALLLHDALMVSGIMSRMTL